MPTFEVGTFRVAFPEFADTVKYPSQMIEFWAALAQAEVSFNLWKTQYLTGIYLYTAHQITIAAQNIKLANVGGAPGSTSGITNTKTVGNVTVGYDASTSTEKSAGFWNQTTYGKNFIRLARIYGAGAIQITGSVFGRGRRSCW